MKYSSPSVQQHTSLKLIAVMMLALMTIACDQQKGINAGETLPGRWYSQTQVDLGETVFQKNCAVCHGKKAEQTINWKQRLPDGSYPPPPLNGTAHAWHHPMAVLLQTINQGGAPVGGKMPSFKHILSKQEKISAIAYFQHFWNDEIYAAWIARGGLE